jgi:mannose-6-phosphate isomerase-like protein (cupin superfamily)
MPVEMDAGEIRRMSPEERAKYDAEVERRLIRFKNLRPNWFSFDEAKIPGNERALFRYVGTGASDSPAFRAPIPVGENCSFAVIIAAPGKGAPLHAHTTEEVFIPLTGRWSVYWGDQGQHEVILEPWDCVSVPAPCMRGFRNVGTEDAYLLAVVGGGAPPPPIYHELVIQQMEEWRGRHAAAKPVETPVPAR